MAFALPVTTATMEAKLVEALPDGDNWQFEPKWDGFRCLAFKSGDHVELRSKSGKSLARFFPDIVSRVAAMHARDFVIDGEIIIVVDGKLAFDALQMRLHPAAGRVEKLAREQPARFMVFDCLARNGVNLTRLPLSKRRVALEKLVGRGSPSIELSPYTRDLNVAGKWLKRSGRALDGVIAKQIDGPYVSGERAMLKVKRTRHADCVVAGFRYASNSNEVGSLLLGLYDDEHLLHHVGFTSTISNAERDTLTKRLEKLKGEGFTGRAPGGPSRWSSERSGQWVGLKPKLIVEVRYDQVTDDRFRHGTKLVRWRPDKAARQCTFDQLNPPAPPAEVAALLRQSRR